MMEKVIKKAPAKINLGLFVKKRRADGYHEIQTLFYPVRYMSDLLFFDYLPSERCEVEMNGLEEKVPLERNLCYKAWKLMSEIYPTVAGLHISVSKNIPAGAGLGGGSSNAAATLKAVNEMYKLELSDEVLAGHAAQLGADVAFFIYGKPMLGEGIGEKLEAWPLELRSWEIRLVTPEIHSSTPAAYQGLDLSKISADRDLREVLNGPIESWKEDLVNDLEEPVMAQYPQIRELKELMYEKGAVYAAMSGSGSAVFGLFKREW